MAGFTSDSDLLRSVLSLVARADAHDCLWWSALLDDDTVSLFVNCSNLFTQEGDVEAITADRLEVFRTAFADTATAAGGDMTWAPLLYVCRVRGVRPQQSAYPTDTRLWPLIDACGPDPDLPAEPGPNDFVVLR